MKLLSTTLLALAAGGLFVQYRSLLLGPPGKGDPQTASGDNPS
jgi:hypothetical protein